MSQPPEQPGQWPSDPPDPSDPPQPPEPILAPGTAYEPLPPAAPPTYEPLPPAAPPAPAAYEPPPPPPTAPMFQPEPAYQPAPVAEPQPTAPQPAYGAVPPAYATPQHAAPVPIAYPPSARRSSASWGPGALAALLLVNSAYLTQYLLTRYWIKEPVPGGTWNYFYAGAAAFALIGLILVRPAPSAARVFGFIAGGLGAVPLLYLTEKFRPPAKILITNVVPFVAVMILLGLIAALSQPRRR